MKNIIIILLALTIAHQAMNPITIATADSCQALAVDTMEAHYNTLLVQAKELF